MVIAASGGSTGPASTTDRIARLATAARDHLPRGNSLSEDAWRSRHRVILALVGFQAFALALYGLYQGFGLTHSLLEGCAVIAAPVFAEALQTRNRTLRATAASIGLITSSAVLTHLSGGYVEAHFHFFVMLAVIALYQTWIPFLFSITYVLIHHGLMGAIDPHSVYNHPDAIAHPWKWALIHAAFVSAACAAYVVAWRLTEDAQKGLRESEERFRALVQNSSDVITVMDREGLIAYASPATERLMGYGPDEWQAVNILSLIHPDDVGRAEQSLAGVAGNPGVHPPTELRIRHRDGTWRTFETVASNMLDDPAVRGIVHNSRDVTQRHAVEAALRDSEERFRRLAQHSPVGVYETSPDRSHLYLNPAGLALLEADNAEQVREAGQERFFGAASLQTVAIEQQKRIQGIASNYEVELTGLRGTRRTVLISGAPVFDAEGQLHNIVGTIIDISDRKRLEEELRRQAFHDALTTLANRALFIDRLEHALDRGRRTASTAAVLFLDLDNFKSINDRFGHSVGDVVLVEVARRLAGCLRPGDSAARFGGDEFAILLEDLASLDDAAEVAERLLQVLSTPFVWQEKDLSVQASIGIAPADRRSASTEEILRNADVAMYAAKGLGKGRVETYEESMHLSMLQRLELAGDLQRAVERNELLIHYQPTFELRSGRVVGIEALVRWNHPRLGLLSPSEFIPIAEQSNAIVRLGTWVLRTACMQFREWQALGATGDDFTLSVNISVRQVQRPEFVGEVKEVLRESGISPHHLTLEVTESLMMHDAASTARRLRELKDLGIRLAIDDFGTGYSSLSYLSQFPFDVLKIDKSFVDGAGTATDEKELVPAIIELGRTLKMQIVAEGIERPEQLARLQGLDCELGQGFLFAVPLTADEVEAMLISKARQSRAA